MRGNGAGSVNMSVLACVLAGLASLAAVIIASMVVLQVREEGRLFRESVRLEVLWHLTDRWNSEEMGDIRSEAAMALLSGNPGTSVGVVLDFFGELALVINRGLLDDESAAQHFYWPLANYWAACTAYVQQVRHQDPSAWRTIPDLVERLGKIEALRRRQRSEDLGPSRNEVERFLLLEQGDNECTDDSEVQKTPA